MGKGARLRMLAWSAIFICAGKVALSYAQSPASSLRSSEVSRAADIRIPSEAGYILETHEPNAAAASHPQIVVHIQEAHTNYEGQQHIITILEELIAHHGLKLILVEGSEGDASLTYLRKYGPPENRRQVAEKYLKAGIISAEEYLDIVSDDPLILWGVEQRALYDANVKVFLETESIRASARPLLESILASCQELESRLMNPAAVELAAKAKAFEAHELDLADYAQALAAFAERAGSALERYPHLQRFLEVHRLESEINVEEARAQQQRLIGQLSEQAGEADLERLVATSAAMKQGTAKPVEFYTLLEELAATSRIDLAAYPALSRYTRYLAASDAIVATDLADELDAASAQLRDALSVTSESQALTRIQQDVDLVEKLLDFQLSPAEYERQATLDWSSTISGWETFFQAQLAHHGLSPKPFTGLSELASALRAVQRFYDVAQQRDAALVNNTLKKLQETGEPLAVLITGGFHGPRITQLLKDRGVGAVVVTPKISTPTDERLYHAVVKYKSGLGSFDEVMAIANQQ